MFSDAIEEGIMAQRLHLKNQDMLMNRIVSGITDATFAMKNNDAGLSPHDPSTDDETSEGCTIYAYDKKAKVVIERNAFGGDIRIEGFVTNGADNTSRVSLSGYDLNDTSDADRIIHEAGVALGECIATLHARNL